MRALNNGHRTMKKQDTLKKIDMRARNPNIIKIWLALIYVCIHR